VTSEKKSSLVKESLTRKAGSKKKRRIMLGEILRQKNTCHLQQLSVLGNELKNATKINHQGLGGKDLALR